jgi:hypothetical protein
MGYVIAGQSQITTGCVVDDFRNIGCRAREADRHQYGRLCGWLRLCDPSVTSRA